MKEITFNRPVLHASSILSGGRVSANRKANEETLAAGTGGKKDIFSAHHSQLCVDFLYLYFET